MMTTTKNSPTEDLNHAARTDENLGRIVDLLAANSMFIVSGTKIAEDLQISRSEVWRLVEHLRHLGVRIAGHPSDGYQLEAVPDLLLPELLYPLVRGTVFDRHIHHYFRIDSTNTSAMRAGAEGAPDGTVFLAEEQVGGRGRGGHSWTSEAGVGIYCSVMLRPAVPPLDVLILSMMAGVAVYEAVKQVTGVEADLRWPNDVMIGNRKFCGILTELNAEMSRVRHVVIGMGINVNQKEFAEDLRPIATSLAVETGHPCSRVEVAAALLRSLDAEYKQFVSDPAEARKSIMRRFSERSSYVLGTDVHVEEDGGYDGETIGLDDRGFLRVQTSQGIRVVLSGGVRKR